MFWNLIIGLISFGLNLILAPKPQDAKPKSLEDFDAPVAEEGLEIPEVFGTANLRAPNVTWYGDLDTRAIKGARRYGLFGPRQTVGHTYRLGMQMVICMGPVDELKEVWVGDVLGFSDGIAAEGLFRIDASFDGQGGDNDVAGPVRFYPGNFTQLQNAYLQEVFEEINIPAFRGVCTLVLEGVQVGNSTYIAPWETKVQRIFLRPDGSDQWYPATAAIARTGSGFFEHIALPGVHQSTGSDKQYADLANDRVARISSGNLQIFDALTGDLLSTTSLGFTASSLMASALTNEVFVWNRNNLQVSVYDLESGALKQVITHPASFGGSGYTLYDFPGHVREVDGVVYWMFANLISIVCYKKVGDDWALEFSEGRGFIFGGFPRNLFFNDEFIYHVHGDGHITIHPWNRSGIGPALGTRYTAPKWSYTPPLGLGTGQLLPTYVALSYLEDTEQILLVVSSGSGHIYLLSKDMLTQIDHIDNVDASGVGLWPGYTVSNSINLSTQRVYFYSGPDPETIRSYSLNPLAFVAEYERDRWDLSAEEFHGGFGVMAESGKYILMSESGAGSDTILMIGADYDMNPIHMIRECITHRMGYLPDDIDDTIFTDAADVLYNEQFGLTFTWSREEEVGEFINMILSHIDAYLYTSRISGKFVIKLVRDDFDIDEIPVIDEDDVIEWMEVSRRTLADSTNSVIIKFSNREHSGEDSERGKDGSHQVDNIAQMQQMAYGGIPDRVQVTRHYPGISTGTLADRVGQRDVKSLGVGMVTGRIRCKRTVESLNPGDPFRLVSARHNLEGEVMRVADIQLGDGRSNYVTIQFIQDVFKLGEEGLVDTTPSDWENPVGPPQPSDPRLLWEAPYRRLIDQVGSVQADSLLTTDPDMGIIEVAGVRGTNDQINAEVWTALDGSPYVQTDTVESSPGGLLSSGIDEDDTSITLTEYSLLDEIVVGSLAVIDGNDRDLMEIVRIESVAGAVITVSRGVSDTVPKSHLADSNFIVYEDSAISDGETYTDDQVVNAKLLTINLSGTLAIGSAPSNQVTMDSRAIRPFRPAACTLNGQAYGILDAELIDPIPAAWVNRNRLTDLVTPLGWNDPTEAMEAGQTAELRLMDIDGTTEIHVYSGLTGTTQNIDPADFGDRATALVKFDSLRDGYTAWQAHTMTVLLPANLLLSGDQQSGTDFLAMSGDQSGNVLRLSGTLA